MTNDEYVSIDSLANDPLADVDNRFRIEFINGAAYFFSFFIFRYVRLQDGLVTHFEIRPLPSCVAYITLKSLPI